MLILEFNAFLYATIDLDDLWSLFCNNLSLLYHITTKFGRNRKGTKSLQNGQIRPLQKQSHKAIPNKVQQHIYKYSFKNRAAFKQSLKTEHNRASFITMINSLHLHEGLHIPNGSISQILITKFSHLGIVINRDGSKEISN